MVLGGFPDAVFVACVAGNLWLVLVMSNLSKEQHELYGRIGIGNPTRMVPGHITVSLYKQTKTLYAYSILHSQSSQRIERNRPAM